MDKVFLIICFVGIICGSLAVGQEKGKAPLILNLKAHYGFVIIHSRDIRPIGIPIPGLSRQI